MNTIRQRPNEHFNAIFPIVFYIFLCHFKIDLKKNYLHDLIVLDNPYNFKHF